MGSTAEPTTNLPIIDLSPFVSPTSIPESRLKCAQPLVQACHSTSSASYPPGSNVFSGYSKVGHEIIPEMQGENVKGVVDFNESYGMGHDEYKGQPNIRLPDPTLPGYRTFVNIFYPNAGPPLNPSSELYPSVSDSHPNPTS
ncbi:hypothetical protein BDZ45DRAFT_746229 [Acephala macrosclerotiorum]|nr:hypothetical protein BDZ45DRAFT_746229 [Acephala macrosclerotiorum]